MYHNLGVTLMLWDTIRFKLGVGVCAAGEWRGCVCDCG